MKRLLYTIIAILIIIIAVVIAMITKNTNEEIHEDITSLSGDTQNVELKKITVSEVTHSIFYAPQYVAMNLRFL